jgi:hypothetical protein
MWMANHIKMVTHFSRVHDALWCSLCAPTSGCCVIDQGFKGDKAQEKAMDNLVAKLNVTWIDMKKAIATATKIFEAEFEVPSPYKRLQDGSEALQALLQYTETLHSDLGWSQKFRTCKHTKVVLNLSISQSIQKKAAEGLLDLLEAGKACKALLPNLEMD